MNLRDYAKGQPCQIRGPTCNGNPETTVLCHIRLIGISGMGLKAPDLLAAWGCSDCHAYVDYRGTEISKWERDLLLLRGVARTINALIKQGYVKW